MIGRKRDPGPPERLTAVFHLAGRRLEVTLTPSTSAIEWLSVDDRRHVQESGGHGMIWKNGRLTSRGEGDDDRRAFAGHLHSFGMSPGAVELELRLMTGYTERRASAEETKCVE